ncbi:hypothetical protein Scep_021278 [Stephania cephalantha]|uniref:Uncharacterized protein n=1 Tax=Stephania cephalantha TaxID=152367 RepID=A0AAP0F423_9MAGN
MEVIVACYSAMAIEEEKQCKKEIKSKESLWDSWKQRGIIGVLALIGGTRWLSLWCLVCSKEFFAGLLALAPDFRSSCPKDWSERVSSSAQSPHDMWLVLLRFFASLGACFELDLQEAKWLEELLDIEEFEFKTIGENHNQGRLAVGIMISDLFFEEEDFVRPWEGYQENLEGYVLRWETENLIAIGHAIRDWLTSKIAVAEALLGGLQGNKPVTLIGFSLGARLIFKCLECLVKTRDDGG